jgi:hypothetical protein
LTGKFGQLPREGRADISGDEYAGKTLLALESHYKLCSRAIF